MKEDRFYLFSRLGRFFPEPVYTTSQVNKEPDAPQSTNNTMSSQP